MSGCFVCSASHGWVGFEEEDEHEDESLMVPMHSIKAMGGSPGTALFKSE